MVIVVVVGCVALIGVSPRPPLGLIPGKLWCDAKGWKELDITLFSIQLY